MNHTAAADAASPHRRQSVIGDLVVAGDDDEYMSYTLQGRTIAIDWGEWWWWW